MPTVLIRWFILVALVAASAIQLTARLVAQDTQAISDREACRRVRTFWPLTYGAYGVSMNGYYKSARPTALGLAVDKGKNNSKEFAYADIASAKSGVDGGTPVIALFLKGGSQGFVFHKEIDASTPSQLAAAINHLVKRARSGNTVDCIATAPDEKAALNDFSEKTAGWRALAIKPAISEEVNKKRLLAEDAVDRKDLDAAITYYDSGTALDPTWAQGWFNAALLYAAQEDYESAADHIKRYLILLPDAPDAAEAKQKQLLWEAKAEEATAR